jgi:hypothetical protein
MSGFEAERGGRLPRLGDNRSDAGDEGEGDKSPYNWPVDVGRNSQPLRWERDSSTPTVATGHSIGEAGCNAA